jgi:hypothetical protein
MSGLFCQVSSPAQTFNDTQLQALYIPTRGQAIVQDSGTTIPSNSSVATRVTSLAPSSNVSTNNINEYSTKLNTLQNNIRTEYCFYFVRYYDAVDKFLRALSRGKNDNTRANQLLQIVLKLNARLTYLSIFTNELSKKNYSTARSLNTEINSLNNAMLENKRKLDDQRKLFEKENLSVETNRRLVEFTQEKNRANNNLLAMYGVLNVIAFSMLIYVART